MLMKQRAILKLKNACLNRLSLVDRCVSVRAASGGSISDKDNKHMFARATCRYRLKPPCCSLMLKRWLVYDLTQYVRFSGEERAELILRMACLFPLDARIVKGPTRDALSLRDTRILTYSVKPFPSARSLWLDVHRPSDNRRQQYQRLAQSSSIGQTNDSIPGALPW